MIFRTHCYPNIFKIVKENWNILQIKTEFQGVFKATLMIAFKRSKNLFKKFFEKSGQTKWKFYTWQFDETITMLYTSIKYKFMNQQTKRTFNTFYKLTCISQYVIYLMECILCKIQYVGKFETLFKTK